MITVRHDAIVLVEDNPDDEALALRALRSNNIANPVVICRDGAEALETLLAWPDDPATEGNLPAVVLLDLKLPKVDGLEVLRRLRADPGMKLTPVVILTSSKEEEDIARAYSLGTNAYVRKPVNFAQFVAAVKQLGVFWLLLNEVPPMGSG